MANVGRGDSGNTLIGQGNTANPTFAPIGTDSGLTQHGVVVAEGNNAFVALSPGSAGQVLVSNGAGLDPSFQNASSSGAVTSITGNSGGAQTPSSGNFNVVGTGSITTVGTANTETVQLTGLTNHAVLVGAGTATITKVGPSATAGQVFQSGGAGADPSYSTATYPTTTTANQILYSSATNTVGQITTANNSILSTNGSGVPSLGTSLSNDYTFTTATAGATRTLTVSNTDNTSGSSNAISVVSTGGTSSGDCYSRYAVGTARSYSSGIDNSDSQAYKISTAANGTADPSSGNNLMRISNLGVRTLPLNPTVFAYVNNGGANLTNVTGDGTTYTVIFDSEVTDLGGNFNTTTGVFTAPVTGRYLISANLTLTNLSAGHTSGQMYINANGALSKNYFNPIAGAVSGSYTTSMSVIYAVTSGGTITIQLIVSGSTKTVGLSYDNFGFYTNVSINLIS